MNPTDTPEPLTREQVAQFLADWDIVEGQVGDYGKRQACTMSAAVALTRVRAGKDMNGATDQLECVDPVIRRLVIARNDVTGVEDADRKAFAIATIPRIVGTSGGKELSVKRAEHIARYAIRVMCAETFDLAHLPEAAAKLRSIGDATSMSDCHAVASAARDAAKKELGKRYAAASAAAAASADAASDAASAASYAAAARLTAALRAYAASAAAYAYAAAYAARRDFRLKHLDQMIADCLAITE